MERGRWRAGCGMGAVEGAVEGVRGGGAVGVDVSHVRRRHAGVGEGILQAGGEAAPLRMRRGDVVRVAPVGKGVERGGSAVEG